MLQGGALLPNLTVSQSVALIAAAHRHPLSVAEALERARVTDIAKQKVGKLCGGQLQRARFAVAIVSDPDLLSSTSRPPRWTSRPATRSGRRCASSPTTGRTVVFATHYLDEADAFADRIVILIADGSSPTAPPPRSRRS